MAEELHPIHDVVQTLIADSKKQQEATLTHMSDTYAQLRRAKAVTQS